MVASFSMAQGFMFVAQDATKAEERVQEGEQAAAQGRHGIAIRRYEVALANAKDAAGILRRVTGELQAELARVKGEKALAGMIEFARADH